MTSYSKRSKTGIRWLAWILSITMIWASSVPTAFSAEICGPGDLANVPLELLGGSGPPPLFMIIFNNTDSMDFEIMTGGADNGRLPTPSARRSKYSISHVYRTDLNANAPAIENVDFYGAWKGMCPSYNKMFYDPTIEYTPWPRWDECAAAPAGSIDQPSGRQPDLPDGTTNGTNAHVNAPRPEPMKNSSVYDLTQNFGLGFGEGDPYLSLGTAQVNQELPVDASPDTDAYPGWRQLATGLSLPTGVIRIEVNETVNKIGDGSLGSVGNEVFAGDIRLIGSDGSEHIIPAYPSTDPGAAELYGPGNGAGWLEFPPSSPTGYLTEDPNYPGDYSIVWTKADLDSALTYTVLTKWAKSAERSTKVDYDIYTPNPDTIQVIRRHFYLESSDGFFYLIELLDADNANFYQVDDSVGAVTDKVEKSELTATLWTALPADIQAVIPAPSATPGDNVYEYQLQNFANWFSFFRTRGFAAKNAIAVTIDEMDNVMIGLMTVPPTNARECRWVDTEFDGIQQPDHSLDLMNFTYMLPDPGGNPNYADAILNAGTYFEGGAGAIPSQSTGFINDLEAAGYSDAASTYPYFTQNYGGQCQHAFALMISDGSAGGSSNIPNYDADNGYPFADGFEDTMADGAMHYYERDLHPELTNDVPTNSMDDAEWQHMVTYGISFGVDGQVRQNYPDCNALCDTAGCCPSTWPDPWASKDPDVIAAAGLDDLYHATVNSRGVYLYASNPKELVDQMRKIKSDIERRTGAAAAVTTNTVQRQIGSTLYQGLYDSTSWFGDVQAFNVNPRTGAVEITNPPWGLRTQAADGVPTPNTAASLLTSRDYTTRLIYTNYGGTAKTLSAAAGDIGLTTDQLNYIRGDRTNEDPAGFRERHEEFGVLGDIVHSEPFFHEGVLYVGANDGMMHAFDSTNGEELFAYVPSMVHDNLYKLTLNTFIDDHLYYVNASPHAETIAGSSYLAGGLGKGGKGVYSLNLLDMNATPTPSASEVFNWELTSDLDSDMGYVYGRVYVDRTTAGPVVIFGNGYASDSGKAVLYVVNADTGIIIEKFDTSDVAGASVVGCNGLSSPALIDVNIDDVIDYVYAGDLYGNLWKFDLRGPSSGWSITNSYGGNPLFTARDDTGKVQPITSEPDVMRHCNLDREGLIVVFGTGRYLNEDDLATNVAAQSFYGIYDWEEDWVAAGKVAADKYLGELGTGGALSNTTASLQVQQKVQDVPISINGEIVTFIETTSNPINYFDPISETGDHAGWVYTLPNSSERVTRNPNIIAGIVFFITNTMSAGVCSGSGASYLYGLDACSGAAPGDPQFDITGDQKVNEADRISPSLSGQYFNTTLFDPVAGPDVLYINDTFGDIVEQPIPPNPPKMNYWILHE